MLDYSSIIGRRHQCSTMTFSSKILEHIDELKDMICQIVSLNEEDVSRWRKLNLEGVRVNLICLQHMNCAIY